MFESENNFALEREYVYPLLESYPEGWISGFFVVDDILYVAENFNSGFMSAFKISDGTYLGEWFTVLPGTGLAKQFSSWYYDDTRDEVVAANYIRGSHLIKGVGVFSGYYFDAHGNVTSTEVGPAREWKNFTYDIVGGSALAKFTASVAGFNSQTLNWDTLAVNVASPYPLNQVDESVYTRLKAFFTFTDSSLSSTNPIYLKKVAFEASTGLPEITISNNDFTFTPDSLMQGFDINIDLKITNVGKVDSDSCLVQLYLGAANEPFYTTKIKIPTDSFYTVKHTINTSKIVFHNKVKAVVTMDGTEMFTFNNLGADSFYVARDTIKPDFKLTFDGKEIINGDIIANSPLIEITLTDNSPLPLDTTRLSIVHNGKPIGFVKDSVHFSYTPYPNSKLYVSWKPVFKEGKQTLEVFTKDASDIPYSSVAQKYQFFVFDKDAIERIYNYPNPFTDETWFTYELRGNTLPDEVKIKIFTIAGRLIKELVIPSTSMQIGLNKIYWDGRDADGDEIANGVYLYKLITKYKDKTKTTIEKIAKVK
ncbi:MAG: T9SS type A sorting domain-containing protein [Ignavibacteriales bacterium]|nr:T9SS type A sorting domain-containing protein [Ignavibacteriales bacterium]